MSHAEPTSCKSYKITAPCLMVLVAKRDYTWLEPQTWEMIGGGASVFKLTICIMKAMIKKNPTTSIVQPSLWRIAYQINCYMCVGCLFSYTNVLIVLLCYWPSTLAIYRISLSSVDDSDWMVDLFLNPLMALRVHTCMYNNPFNCYVI